MALGLNFPAATAAPTPPPAPYKAPRYTAFVPGGGLISGLMVCGVFLLLPITLYFAPQPQGERARNFSVSLPPPPPPPPDPPPQENEPPPQEQPEMKPQAIPLSLSGIGLNIEVGVGSALAADFGLPDAGGVQAEDTLKDISVFNLSDLDERPRKVSDPGPFQAPRWMVRDRVEARAIIKVIINPDGRPEISDFIEVSHPELKDALIAWIEQTRFTPPMRQGKPVAAQYGVPWELKW